MAQPFLGQITVYPYTFPPYGWADCAGQLLLISQNAALFSLLGTQFGGNGTTNFALPNLQGRVPVAQGQGTGLSPYIIGETTGTESVALILNQMASHNHSLNATTTHGTVNAPAGNVLATPETGNPRDPDVGRIYNPGSTNTILQANSVALACNGNPHNNIQPFLVLRYCIALSGTYPQRN
jgi:microcystin-dependent protein